MAILEDVIPQQIVKKVVCDICGKKADGDYNSTTYLNDVVGAEYSCPHDLCKNHMKIFRFRNVDISRF